MPTQGSQSGCKSGSKFSREKNGLRHSFHFAHFASHLPRPREVSVSRSADPAASSSSASLVLFRASSPKLDSARATTATCAMPSEIFGDYSVGRLRAAVMRAEPSPGPGVKSTSRPGCCADAHRQVRTSRRSWRAVDWYKFRRHIQNREAAHSAPKAERHDSELFISQPVVFEVSRGDAGWVRTSEERPDNGDRGMAIKIIFWPPAPAQA